MKKLLCIFLVLLSFSARADILSDCLNSIVKDDKIWQDLLFDKQNGIFKDLSDSAELTEEIVNLNKAKIYTLIAKDMEVKCPDKLAAIAKHDRAQIPFKYNNEDYGFDFSIETMFEHINEIRTGILVINKRNLSAGQVLKLSDIPKSTSWWSPYHFFSDECSDHTIADNLDDDAAVNIAGQAVFNEFGGSQNEFFLDFADGNDRRAFPGLVLMDETHSRTEKIVTYINLKTGIIKAQQFAEKLKGSQCSNQGLAVYLVALNVQKDSSNSSMNGWAIGLLSGSAASAGVALYAGAVAVATVPVVGWVVAGVLATAGTVVSLVPEKIEEIDQVMILDGPYLL